MIDIALIVIFSLIIIIFLIADLGFFNKKSHVISFNSALKQSIFWVVISLLFSLVVLYLEGKISFYEFLSAYVTEKMLSIDNLFVILLIFKFFNLEEKYYHKVLFWGILGAIISRGVFIGLGTLIISYFHFVLYIFGAILVYTGIKLFFDKKDEHVDLEKSKILKLLKKYLPLTTEHHNGKFIVKHNGKILFTSLFLIVLMVESTDILFAIDSIPAAFAISQNGLVIFTSNILAVLGLRAMFFMMETVLTKFKHLQHGLSAVLIFIGSKMLLEIIHIKIESVYSLLIVMIILVISIAPDLFPKNHK